MIVSIFRHGEAADAANDRQRPLTQRGEREIANACAPFVSACEHAQVQLPSALLHSPWLRTTQTANILAEISNSTELVVCDALYPGGNVADVERTLDELLDEGSDHVMLVSHQPLVSYLLSHFLTDSSAVPPMAPGAWVTFSLDVVGARGGQLAFWAVPPVYEVQR